MCAFRSKKSKRSKRVDFLREKKITACSPLSLCRVKDEFCEFSNVVYIKNKTITSKLFCFLSPLLDLPKCWAHAISEFIAPLPRRRYFIRTFFHSSRKAIFEFRRCQLIFLSGNAINAHDTNKSRLIGCGESFGKYFVCFGPADFLM